MSNLHVVGVTPDVTLVTTAETLLATCSTFAVDNPAGQGVYVSGVVAVTAGAAATGIQLRVRADSLAGTLIMETLHTLAATASACIPYACLDPNLSDTSAIYVVTAQQVAATGNGNVTSSTISAQAATSRE